MQQIIERYNNMVYAIALTHTSNRVDADDVFQEVFLAYQRHINDCGGDSANSNGGNGNGSTNGNIDNNHGFNSEEHRKAWLIRTTVNCSLKITQSSWSKRVVLIDESHQMDDSLDTLDGSPSNPFDNLDNSNDQFTFRTAEQDTVFAALQALNDPYKTVLHLFYFEDLSVKTIASLLDQQPGTIKTQLSRGRAMMRERLESPKGAYFND